MDKQAASKKKSTLKKCLKAPFKALLKARDLYMKAMMGCAGQFGNPATSGQGLPKSYSTASSRMSGDDEYIRDLIRAASTKTYKDKLELEKLRADVMGIRAGQKGGDETVLRSQSVAVIGRIDENAPSDFGDDVRVNVDLVPRSRSHAIPRSRASLMLSVEQKGIGEMNMPT